jgi:hypothetical protein
MVKTMGRVGQLCAQVQLPKATRPNKPPKRRRDIIMALLTGRIIKKSSGSSLRDTSHIIYIFQPAFGEVCHHHRKRSTTKIHHHRGGNSAYKAAQASP